MQRGDALAFTPSSFSVEWLRASHRRCEVPKVEKFNRGVIEKVIRRRNWKFLVDSDGDFRVSFAYDDDVGCQMDLYLGAEGSQSSVYTIRVTTSKRIPKSEWDRALMACNTWNRDKRWPKAYLYVEDPSADSTGSIILEHSTDLETGIHQELLDDLTMTIWATANQFWRWATKEQGL